MTTGSSSGIKSLLQSAWRRFTTRAQDTSGPKPDSAIWIASYPKSGNTWVQAIVREAGKPYGFPQGDLNVYPLQKDNLTPAVVNGIRPDICPGKGTVLKTHNLHLGNREIHPRLRLRTAGFVYVMRNPLDVLLSYINFTRLQYKSRQDWSSYQQALFVDLLGFDRAIPYGEWAEMKLEKIPRANLDHALGRFTDNGTTIPSIGAVKGSWLDHMLSWHKAGRTVPSVFLQYENLLKGPEQFLPLGRLFTFTETQILEAASTINQQLRNQQYKNIFYNKMSACYYPNFFSGPVIRRFLDRFETELKQLGYGSLPDHAQ